MRLQLGKQALQQACCALRGLLTLAKQLPVNRAGLDELFYSVQGYAVVPQAGEQLAVALLGGLVDCQDGLVAEGLDDRYPFVAAAWVYPAVEQLLQGGRRWLP